MGANKTLVLFAPHFLKRKERVENGTFNGNYNQLYDMQLSLNCTYDEEYDMANNNIISDIDSNRFKFTPSEKEKFLGNPLFLTIIVATYQYTHNIQTKRYLFYDDTYRVMYKEHDGVKGLTRPYDTNLDEDDFIIYKYDKIFRN